MKMGKEVNFIFIDESVTEEIDIASLTGLVVPLEKFENIRTDFYKIINKILDVIYPERTDTNKIDYPPILHARTFLQNSRENSAFDFSNITDEFRIEMLREVLGIIRDYNLLVIRLGYSNYKEIKRDIRDDKLHNTNWYGLSSTLDSIYQNSILIPVMEGIDSKIVSKFSHIIWGSNCLRELYPRLSKSLMLKNPNNFYGSVFFTQSKYTECIQIVDIVSYLLQKADYIKIKGTKSEYSNSMISTLSILNEENLINSIIKMKTVKQ